MALNPNKRGILAKTGSKVKPISSSKPVATYGVGVALDDETENALVRASPDYEDAVAKDRKANPEKVAALRGTSARVEPEGPSKSDTLRDEGFDGLAELEDMQTRPIGSGSSLSGPGSRRMISSPARSLERQARRYQKFGRAGEHAAAQLLAQAAEERTKTPSLRTEAGVKAGQTADTVADNLASSAISRSSAAGNEMPPPEEQSASRRRALNYHRQKKFY